MIASLKAIAPGPFVTLQDSGRRGWMRYGVPGSGAMDNESLAVANALVGNTAGHAALEFAHVGGEWEVTAWSCRIAVTGGSFSVTVDGERLAANASHTLTRGQRLKLMGAPDAVWGYLAVAGGFDVRQQLGSLSTHLRSGIGGLHGSVLAAGDELPLCLEEAPDGPEHRFHASPRPSGPLRVVLGPQDDYFTPAAIETFLGSSYQVTHQGDRQGYRLAGPPLEHAKGYNIISDAPVPGCIQVPGAGQPIVLLADCQTIGGYPKIATVITADLGRFAQCRPGRTITFDAVDVREAQRLYRADRDSLETIGHQVEPIAARVRRPFWLLQ